MGLQSFLQKIRIFTSLWRRPLIICASFFTRIIGVSLDRGTSCWWRYVILSTQEVRRLLEVHRADWARNPPWLHFRTAVRGLIHDDRHSAIGSSDDESSALAFTGGVTLMAFVAEDLYSVTSPAPRIEFEDEYGWIGA